MPESHTQQKLREFLLTFAVSPGGIQQLFSRQLISNESDRDKILEAMYTLTMKSGLTYQKMKGRDPRSGRLH